MSDEDDYYSEEYRTDFEPNEEEIKQYCEFIGLDLTEDPDLIWIAKEGLTAPLPAGWKQYRSKKDENVVFFFNTTTGDSIFDHPSDQYYKELYLKEKKKKMKEAKKKKKSDNPASVSNPTSVEEPPPIIKKKVDTKKKTDDTKKRKDINKEKDDFEQELAKIKSDHNKSIQEIKRKQEEELENEKRILEQIEERRKKNENDLTNLDKSLIDVKSNQLIEISKLNSEHQRRIMEIKNKNQAEQNQLVSSFENEKSDLQNKHNHQISEMKNKHERELNEIKAVHASKMNELHENNNKEIAQIKSQFQETVDKLKQSHEKKLTSIKNKAQKQIELAQTQQYNIESSITKDELKKKKKGYENELEKLKTEQEQIISQTKSSFQNNLNQLKKENDRAYQQIQQEGQRQIQEYKEKIEREKKAIAKQKKSEKLEEFKRRWQIESLKVVTVRPKNQKKKKKRLHRSSPFAISYFEDPYLSLDRPKTIFQLTSPPIRPLAEFDASTIIPTKNLPLKSTIQPIEDLLSDQESDAYVERTSDQYRKLKNTVSKYQHEFEMNSQKTTNNMNRVSNTINGEIKDIKTYVQEQSRIVSKTALEFHQQTLEMTRSFHAAVSDLESVHHTAASAMNQLKQNIEIQSSYSFAPQPPQISYANIDDQSFRRSRYKRSKPKKQPVYEYDSEYESDD